MQAIWKIEHSTGRLNIFYSAKLENGRYAMDKQHGRILWSFCLLIGK